MNLSRVNAYRDCLLNTCVRLARPEYPEGTLTLSNCLDSPEFCVAADTWLRLPYFLTPIEPEMERGRKNLLKEIMQRIYERN